jgi:hypothetical protein
MVFVVLAIVATLLAWFVYWTVLPRLRERRFRACNEVGAASSSPAPSLPPPYGGDDRDRGGHHNAAAIVGDATFKDNGEGGELGWSSHRASDLRTHKPHQESDLWTHKFQSGDLVLMRERRSSAPTAQSRGGCCGTGIQISGLVAILSGSRYYHTGVIYVDPRTSQPFLWEMNESGARLASLYDVARSSPSGTLAVRRLAIGKDDRRDIDTLLVAAMRAQWRSRFDYAAPLRWAQRQLCDLFAVGHCDVPKGKRAADLACYSCVSLTTAIYERVGVLDMRRAMLDPRLVVAADYARSRIDDRVLPFRHGCGLGPPVLLVYDSDAQAMGAAPGPLMETMKRRLASLAQAK